MKLLPTSMSVARGLRLAFRSKLGLTSSTQPAAVNASKYNY
ncbi:hypothetical protein AVDCRST_MAG84-6287 [uncultured Microcoleus sp.]|uniref:Uncharacterized protein n=1 Tax=uncultured Microcoleus sp. TaxID=259945 RepID=A0A6J4P6P6_9CYAN|nr:hypothetical protein AVDCRST_MAG84-6287 [uncultured Microcoleus sp.]